MPHSLFSKKILAFLCGCFISLLSLFLFLNPHYAPKVWPSHTAEVSKPQPLAGRNDMVVPPWNLPPRQHVPEATPLFIGFTRNWLLLKQAVVSYIAAGWPASDIYVVEDTGTMTSNALNQLTPENPFYLDHDYLSRTLGVNVLTTPTYLLFAQLQNFFLYTSIINHWPHYFWSHMDVVALTAEAHEPFASLYNRAVDALRETLNDPDWAIRFFSYDHLTLSNVAAYSAVGGFDTFIPYYMTDCDFHFRISQSGHTVKDVKAGLIFDVGDALPDLSLLFRRDTEDVRATCKPGDIKAAESTIDTTQDNPTDPKPYGRGDCRYHALKRMLNDLAQEKTKHKGGRNYWQVANNGGLGEPFWQVPEGFEKAVEMTIEHGRKVFTKKWGNEGCGLKKAGRSCKDAATCSAWRVGKEKEKEEGS